MEWIEITARTVAEAKELAFDRLMVDEDDVEFDIVEEPRQGLFGRMRGEARVRARIKPTPVRQKIERRDRRRGAKERSGTDSPAATASPGDEPGRTAIDSPAVDRSAADSPDIRADIANGEGPGEVSISDPDVDGQRSGRRRRGGRGQPADQHAEPRRGGEDKEHDVDEPTDESSAARVGEEAMRFMNGLITAFGLTATTKLIADGNELEITVEGDNLGLLVGPRGATLQAVQDLARVAAQRRLHDHDTRLRVDIAGYRRRRSESLAGFVAQIAEDVRSTGVARVLEPMSSADRKVIHDSLTEIDGITTRSEGEEPFRRVVIAPAATSAPDAPPAASD
jgi:spoIIIJ-associated protein